MCCPGRSAVGADMRVESAREVGSSEQQLQESLAQARSSRLPSVANRHHHAFMLKVRGTATAAHLSHLKAGLLVLKLSAFSPCICLIPMPPLHRPTNA